MPLEIDDRSIRVIGNRVGALQFYDDGRTLRQEIYLTDDNVLNIGNVGTVSSPSGGGAEGGTNITAGVGISITGADPYTIAVNQAFAPTWTGLHTFSAGIVLDTLPASRRYILVQDWAIDSPDGMVGAMLQLTKTAGASNQNDGLYGVASYVEFDDTDGIIGNTFGIFGRGLLTDGELGQSGSERVLYGGRFESYVQGGTLYGDSTGLYSYAVQTGGAISRDIWGLYAITSLSVGTVGDDAYGATVILQQAAGHTSITGNAMVLHLNGDFDSTVTGTSYMLYLDEENGIDFGIYQAGTAPNYLGGLLLVGLDTAVGGKTEIRATTEQLRLEYDAGNYASFTVGNGGDLTIAPTGDVVFNPTGNDILPTTNYDLNIGSLTKKYLTLHAAELWVETLVAQETVATIGGRVLVGPTTELTRDLNATNAVLNPGFETAGGGGADVFANWAETAGDGAISQDATEYNGAACCKLTAGASANTTVYQAIALTAGYTYTWEFWTRGDGTNAGRYRVYDATNAADIIAVTTTGVTGTAYTRVRVSFVVPGTCTSTWIMLYCPTVNTADARFDDNTVIVSSLWVKHNQMQIGDVAYFEANGAIEFISITGGPTTVTATEYSYGCTRNLDGTGANDWYAGDALFNTGQTGNGWIDLYSLWSMSARRLEYVFNYTAAGGYSANLAASKTYDLFDGPAATNDGVFFGIANEPWENLHFYLSTAAVYNATVTYWYSTGGGTWSSFVPTVSTDFKSTGVQSATWTAGDLTGWTVQAQNGITAYWIYARITVFTSWTTDPVQAGREVRRGTAQFGPTIVGNVRQSATFNDWEPRWAIGNLNGLYGIGNDYYGIGLGDYTTGDYLRYDENGGFIMSAGAGNTTIDANGIRLYSAAAGAAGRRVDMMYVTGGSTYTIGTLYGAYDTGDPNDEAYLWLVSYHGAGDPWTHPRITLSAYDSAASKEAYLDVRTTTFEHVNAGPELTVPNALYVGGETQATASADLTRGIVIQQGNYDDGILVLKSTGDVAHGMTDFHETDSFMIIKKDEGTSGGAMIIGYKDADGVAGHALRLVGRLGEAADTTKTTAAIGVVHLTSQVKSGTGVASVGADGNLAVIANGADARFIFDAEGSFHADVESTTFDEHDDVELLRQVEEELREWYGPNRHAPGRAEGRKKLEDLGLVKFDEENEGHAMRNITNILSLLTGAVRQVDARAKGPIQ